MFEDLRMLSSKFKVLLGLGISGLVALIGHGLRNNVLYQNQWMKVDYLVEGHVKGTYYYWEYGGYKLIYPLRNLGNIFILVGVGIFLLILVYINYLQFHKLKIKIKIKPGRGKE